jgi:hypothetical protein
VPRYSLDLTDDERDQLKAIAAEEERSMMSVMRVVFKRGLRVSISTSLSRQSNVIVASESRQSDACPSPACAPESAGTNLALFSDQDPDQKDPDLKREKDRRGSVRGNLDFGAVAELVVGLVNELKPTKGNFAPSTYKDQITKLIQKGFTENNMVSVIEWKAAECKRKGNWGWFKPGTIFRQGRFGELVDEANAGVELGGSSDPNNQKNKQDYPNGKW